MAREVTEFITPSTTDDLPEGSTNKYNADQSEADIKTLFSWSTSPEDGATPDQTGLEMQTAIVAITDADRVLVGSEPQSGEKKIYGVHINAAGNIEADNEDTAES